MKKHWIILSIVAVIMMGTISLSFVLSRPQGDALYAAVRVAADRLTDQGMAAADTSFTLKSKYRITAEEVRGMLEIEPDIGSFTLSGGRGRSTTWSIQPERLLSDNTVYTIRIKNPFRDGAVIQSFAFQTRSDLSVRSVYPSDGAGYVPLNAGVEIGFSLPGVDISEHFEILPPVRGSFETRDYTAIFHPDQPLERNSIYRVTVKAGLTAPDGAQLVEDYAFSFETTDRSAEEQDYARLRLDGAFAETFLTGDPMGVVMTSGADLSGQQFHVSLQKFPDVQSYIDQVKGYDVYYKTRYGSKANYTVDAQGLEEVASYDGELIESQDGWGTLTAPLPNDLPEGHYLVTVTGESAEGAQQFVQKLIQVKNLSVYSQSVDGETLLWINDPTLGGPVNGQNAVLEDANSLSSPLRGATHADGSAVFTTGEIEQAYLTLEENGKPAYFDLLELAPAGEERLTERFYTGLYADRTLYQPTDSASMWGMVYPRTSGDSLPEYVWLTLRTGWPEQELYRERVAVGADGSFSGALRFSALKKGWYTLAVTDGAQGVYTSQSVSVESYIKPAYSIEVVPERESWFANEQVNFTVRARYLDGTPVAGGQMQAGSGLLSFPNDGRFTLDADGAASISGTWNGQTQTMPSWEPRTDWVSVWSTGAQDVQVSGSARVILLPSAIAAKIESESPDEVTIQTARIDTTKLSAQDGARPLSFYGVDSFTRLRGAAYDLPVVVHITRTEFLRIPDGSYYDYANNETVTRYRTERQETIVDNIRTRTVNGRVTLTGLPYENTADTFYTFEVQFAGGIAGDVVARHSRFLPRYGTLQEGASYRFFPEGEGDRFDANQPVELGLYENGQKVRNAGRVLYSIVQKSVLSTGVFDSDGHTLTLGSQYLPNVLITGAYFDGRHIYPVETSNLAYNYDAQTLRIGLSTGEPAGRPGDTVQVRLSLSDAAGNPVAGSAAVGVVDESVFLLQDQRLDFAAQVYAAAFYPRITRQTSYVAYSGDWAVQARSADKTAEAAAGEGGNGAASAAVREEFLDTASFQTVEVDETGRAVVDVRLPDNVTSWRITAAAVTPDLMAGSAQSSVVATLPVYLRPIVTSSYLVGDDVSISLAVGGSEAGSLTEDVAYTVAVHDADGFQVDGMTATGAPDARVPLNLGKYEEGVYTLTVEVKAGEYADAYRQEFSVLRSAMTVPEIRTMRLAELASLESTSYPVGVTVYDERLKLMFEGLQWLAGQDGDRTEVIASAYLARTAYDSLLDGENPGLRRDARLDEIQQPGEGVRPLPAAQADAAATARMLLAAPGLVDRVSAKGFLEEVLRDPAADPNSRVMAYVGLAALDEPLLLDLNRMAGDDTLTAAQKLWLGAGMAKLGDYAGAQKVYQDLGRAVQAEGKLSYIQTGGSAGEQIEATAAALALTSLTGSADADGFMRYFLAREDDRARVQESVPHLEMLLYTQTRSAAYSKEEIAFTCTLNGEEQRFDLGLKGYHGLRLGREALAAANFQAVSGDLYAAVSCTSYAPEQQALPDSKVAIRKTYTPVEGEVPALGQQIRVDVEVDFADDAPDGCYTITDYLPSGTRLMPSTSQYEGEGSLSFEQDGQMVRAFLYRISEQEEDGSDNSRFVLTYYLSASLPGEFVTERACITPYAEGVSAQTERGTLTIQG